MDDSAGRNDPCPCGSGKKFKKCCLATSAPAPRVIVPTNAKLSGLALKDDCGCGQAHGPRTKASDHADDHSGHDHSGHDHSGHDHSGHDHSGHEHSGHAH